MKTITVLPSVFLFLTGLSTAIVPIRPIQESLPDEDYRVYRAVIEARFLSDDSKFWVIIRTTAPSALPNGGDQTEIFRRLAPLDAATVNSYHIANKTKRVLSDRFKLKSKAVLADEKLIDDMLRTSHEGGWEGFRKHYPNSRGLIRFSRVGFDPGRKQALLFVSSNCGALCGSGTYYFLVRENNDWRIKKEQLIWIS